MAKWNKNYAEEIATYNNKGLRVTYKHLSGIQALAREAGQGDVVEEVGQHLDVIVTESKKRHIHIP